MSKILYPLIHSKLAMPLKYWFYKKSIVINEPLELGTIGTTGKNQDNPTCVRTVGFIDISQSRVWELSRKGDNSNMKVRYYTENKDYIGNNPYVGASFKKELAVPENAYYVRFTLDKVTDLSYFTKYTVCLTPASESQLRLLKSEELTEEKKESETNERN